MSNHKAFTALPRTRPCIRCGIARPSGNDRRPICRTCYAVLTPEERKIWAA